MKPNAVQHNETNVFRSTIVLVCPTPLPHPTTTPGGCVLLGLPAGVPLRLGEGPVPLPDAPRLADTAWVRLWVPARVRVGDAVRVGLGRTDIDRAGVWLCVAAGVPERVACAVWVPVGVGLGVRDVVGVGLDVRVAPALRDRECVLDPERDAPWDRVHAGERV